MFGELPKLLDRNFAIGYFLPMAIFVSINYYLADIFNLPGKIVSTGKTELLIGTTILGLISWLGGILLLVTNRDIYRFLEGYGKYNPLKMFISLEKARYTKILDEINKLDDDYRKCIAEKKQFPDESRLRRNKLMRERAERFPDKEELILPTAFGNTLRAFEIYPRVMYGLEAIDGWSRLLAVVPKDYRELIDNAKTHVDFWINVGLLSVFLLLEVITLSLRYRSSEVLWLIGLFLLTIFIAPWRGQRLAIEWGDLVKSTFDIYRFNLLDSLGLDRPSSRDEEKAIWTKYSQAIVYRLPSSLPDLKKPQIQ